MAPVPGATRMATWQEEREMGAMTMDQVPLFMTPEELARITGEHPASVTRGIREGRIPADKVNGRWRICRDVVFRNAYGARHGSDGE